MKTIKAKKTIDQVSYCLNELDLYYRVKTRCRYMNMSSFYKEAVYEKLEREEHLSDDYIVNVGNRKQENTVSISNLPVSQSGFENMIAGFQ